MKSFLCALVLLLPMTASAERACTMIGCLNGFTIQISPDYRWQPGQYDFTFLLDAKKVHCKGVLPLRPCEQDSMVCDGEGVMITQSGCAMPQETHGFGDIQIDGAPAQVAVTIAREGQVIVSQQWQPRYETSQPNGEGCEPLCKQAHVTLPLK